MKKTSQYFLFFQFVTALFIFNNCSKPEEEEKQDNAIVGRVYLYNEFGNVEKDLSHISVRATNIETDELLQYDTLTIEGGKYRISAPAEGTYKFEFKKEGYSTYIVPDFVFTGSDLDSINLIKLYDTCTSTISINSIIEPNDPLLIVKINRTVSFKADYSEDYNVMLRYFFGTDENVSSTSYFHTYIAETEIGYTGKTEEKITEKRLNSEFFPYVGKDIYVVAYPCNPASYDFEKDTINNEFPGMGKKSNVLSFVINDTLITEDI